MMKKIIKRFDLYIIVCLLIVLFTSCSPNFLLRRRMIKYYCNDENYVELNGQIVSIETVESDDIDIKIHILTEDHGFLTDKCGIVEFKLYGCNISEYGLSVGDNIYFMSAPMYFYNGHDLPIVSLKKDSQVLLDFSKGKNLYLKWIDETF